MCKVSIIVPIYNVETYLSTCVESVFAQTLTDFELILVDDASPDGAPQMCDAYAQKDSRVRVIHQKNGGLAAARNAGFAIARGKYVFCLDSDDCIHPETLKHLYEIAEEEQLDIVQCDLFVVEDDDRSYQHELHQRGRHRMTPYEAYKVLEVNDEAFGHNSRLSTTVTWGKLIRRDVLAKVTPIPPVRIHEDQVLITKLLSVIESLVYVETDYYYYRSRKGSLMNSGWKKEKLVILDVYRERLQMVSNLQNVTDEEKQKLREFMLRRYLICIFRNYIQVRKYLAGDERKALSRELVKRFREEKTAGREVRLGMADRVLFGVFPLCPRMCTFLYACLKRDK